MLFLAVLGLGTMAPAQTRLDLLRSGRLAYLRHDYSTANGDFLAACRMDYGPVDAFYGVGVCQYMMGHAGPARAYAELALARDPSLAIVRILAAKTGISESLALGLADLKKGDPAGAWPLLEVASLQNNGLAWRSKAACALALGHFEDSNDALEHAARIDPTSVDLKPLIDALEAPIEAFLKHADPFSYWQRRGVVLFRQGHAIAAAGAFLNAVRLSPKEVSAWVNLAMARWKSGDWTGMGGALDRAQTLDSGHPGARYLRAIYLRHLGQDRLAVQQLQTLAGVPSGGFSGLAQAGLSQWNTSAAPSGAWDIFVRALAGPYQTVANNLTGKVTTSALGGQDYLRLSGEGFSRSMHPTDLAYGLYLTPQKINQGPWSLGSPYQSIELDQHYRPSSRFDGQVAYFGSVMDSPAGDLSYYSNAAKAQLDMKCPWIFTLSAWGQALWERYPAYSPYDAVSGMGGFNAVWVGSSGQILSLGLGARSGEADVSKWSYRNLNATLYGRLMLFKRCSLSGTALWQPQVYPYFPGGRYDQIGAGTLELAVPLSAGISGLLGDQYNRTLSSVGLFATQSNLAYVGLQYSR